MPSGNADIGTAEDAKKRADDAYNRPRRPRCRGIGVLAEKIRRRYRVMMGDHKWDAARQDAPEMVAGPR